MRSKFIVVGLIWVGLVAATLPTLIKVTLFYPSSWPKPVYDFEKSALSKEGISLGRKLFYDPLLSADSTISCSHCHLSYTAFTHVDHDLSHGIRDSIGTRNSPALMNLAWNDKFMWDGAVNHLDMQALAPITHPAEMGENLNNVIAKLQRTSSYPKLFQAAFGDSIVTGKHILKALSQFQLTLVSANSKYDKMKRGEYDFTEQEQRGYQLFKANCNSCHQEPLFTNGAFENTGLPVDTTLNDYGRMLITKIASDSLRFKVPTLRNIEYSYPYMHDGRFKTIRQVLNHYGDGIFDSETLANELKGGIPLTSNEKVDLTAFLLTLTDKEFLFNPEFAFPRN
ncbi:MAG: c-type cytochrome [Flavobacteriales bacterium]|nr:c-type cytochrome [Flavobacteriales bacterium]